MILWEKNKNLRKVNNITQCELSDILNVSRVQICNIENVEE